MRVSRLGRLLLALGVLGWIAVEAARHHRAAEAKRLEQVAASISDSIQAELYLLATKASELARMVRVLAPDMAEVEALLRRARDSSDHVGFILTGRDYVQRINTSSPGSAGQLARGLDDLNAIFDGAGIVITPLRPNRYTGRLQFGVRVPVPVNDEVTYVLTALVEPSVVQAILARKLLQVSAGVVDETGATIARIPGGQAWTGRPAPPSVMSEMLKKDRGYAEIVDNEGRFAHTAFTTLPHSKWKVGVWSPLLISSSALAWMKTASYLMILAGLSIAVAGLKFGRFFASLPVNVWPIGARGEHRSRAEPRTTGATTLLPSRPGDPRRCDRMAPSPRSEPNRRA